MKPYFWRFLFIFLLLVSLNIESVFASEEEFSDEAEYALDNSLENGIENSLNNVQKNKSDAQDFFIAPLAETLMYGRYNLAYGGGIALGYGSGLAGGIRFYFATDTEQVIFMEMLFFVRAYFFGLDTNSGPFIQLNCGPVLYAHEKMEHTKHGSIAAGLSAGWRFYAGKNFFIEPSIKGGYPYIAGGGISAGYSSRGK